MSDTVQGKYGQFLLYSFLILVSSIDTPHKYFGVTGIAVYVVAGFIFLYITAALVAPAIRSRTSEKQLTVLAAVFMSVPVFAAYFGYKLATSGRFGAGSDADDALIIAANDLVRGIYPYYKATYLGNGISPMPGAVLLSMPFTLTGAIYFQNVFWIAVLFRMLRRVDGKRFMPLAGIALLVAISPTVVQNIITGADYVTNSIYIAASVWMMMRFINDQFSPAWKGTAAAILFGIGLSSRSNFLVLLPLVFSVLYQFGGFWKAFRYMAIAGVACLAVTLPLWLYDPAGFSPFVVQADKVTFIQTVLPFSGVLIPLTGFALAGYFAFRKYSLNDPIFWRNMAITQLVVLLFTTTLYSIKLGKLDLFVGQSGYGMFTLIFAVIAFSLEFFREPQTVPVPDR